MQSSEQRKWIGIGRYKLALVLLGAAAIFLGLAVLGPVEIAGDRTTSDVSTPMTRESFASRNQRFLEFNVLSETVSAGVRGESRPESLARTGILEMNLLPGDSVSEAGDPIQPGQPR